MQISLSDIPHVTTIEMSHIASKKLYLQRDATSKLMSFPLTTVKYLLFAAVRINPC